MKKAYDSECKEHITVEQFENKYGKPIDQFGNKNQHGGHIVCPACDAVMSTRGQSLPLRDQTWVHPRDRTSYCPLKDIGKIKYELLTPTQRSIDQGDGLKLAFFQNWRRHWGFICTLAPMTDVNLFVAWINDMNRKNIWGYQQLEEWQLPYIFLTTCEFPPPTNDRAKQYRSSWIRFFYNDRVRTIEDLWIYIVPQWSLLKLSFVAPNGKLKKPNNDDLISAEIISPDLVWLDKNYREPHEFVVRIMDSNFSEYINKN
jgi:hypothetical protein